MPKGALQQFGRADIEIKNERVRIVNCSNDCAFAKICNEKAMLFSLKVSIHDFYGDSLEQIISDRSVKML